MSKKEKDRIVQIQFFTIPDKGMTLIKAMNTFLNKDHDDSEYDWRRMPLVYEKYLDIIFYRLELLSRCAESNYDADFNRVIRKNLGYLNKILDAIFKQANREMEGDRMNADWRCNVLDMWLSIEGRVGRHDPQSVANYIEEHGSDDLRSDPFEIGTI
jgi:hypothetical protein